MMREMRERRERILLSVVTQLYWYVDCCPAVNPFFTMTCKASISYCLQTSKPNEPGLLVP